MSMSIKTKDLRYKVYHKDKMSYTATSKTTTTYTYATAVKSGKLQCKYPVKRRPRPKPRPPVIICPPGTPEDKPPETPEDKEKDKERQKETVDHALKMFDKKHRVYKVKVHSHHGGESEKDRKPPPDTFTIKIKPDGTQELYLGHKVVHNWNWNKATNTLTWKKGEHAGHMAFPHSESVTGYGTMRRGLTSYSVQATLAPVVYNLDYSTDAGAYVKQEGTALDLVWDDTSDEWSKATWVDNVISFSYGIDEQFFIGQKTYKVYVQFQDLQTNVKYDPAEGDFSFLLTSDFKAVFQYASGTVPDDERDDNQDVFPYLLEYTFSPDASTFDGAVLTKALDAATGQVYAMKGAVQDPVNAEFVMTSPTKASSLVGVSDGRLVVGDEVVPSSKQVGNSITWDAMPINMIALSGLPEKGTLDISHNTSTVKLSGDFASGAMVTSSNPTALASSTSSTLNGEELLSMSQFKQDSDNNYYDYIQQAAMEDFYTIIQYYMDSDLREKYMAMSNAPDLDATIKQIADTNGSPTDEQKANGDTGNASDWYKTLSVAYLTQALPSIYSTDDYADKLNTIRAKQWLKTVTSTASVYMAQTPELYTNRWLQNIPLMGEYLTDQIENNDTYAAYIQQDKSDWEADVNATVTDPDNLSSMLSLIDELTTLGQENKYWAYWFFRDITQQSALSMLQMLSIGGAASLDGSAFSRQIQQNCAILGILDSSAVFQQQYIKVIQIFQLTNILPQLLDFSGDTTNYQYAVNAILTAFEEQYMDSTDPDLEEGAKQIAENNTQEKLEDILGSMQQIASQFTGDYSFANFAQACDKAWAQKTWYTFGKMVSSAAFVGAIMMFYYGVADWSVLDTEDKVQVVTDGVVLFTEAVAGILKRGASFYEIWGSEYMTFQNAGKILLTGDCQEAIVRASNGFTKMLLQKKGSPSAVVEATEVDAVVAGEDDLSLMQTLFGENLDTFMATRFGAALSIIGIVFSAIAYSKSETTLEKVGNAMGITAGCLQLAATLGTWLVPEEATLAGLEVASICSCFGALAVVAAIVGVILLITQSKQDDPSPIEDFAKNQANDEGYYMPYGADIDSFQAYQPEGELEKEGVSLQMGGSSSQYLQFNLDGTLALTDATNGPDTVFYLATDAYGRANFIANLPNSDNTGIESKFLTLDADANLSGTDQLTGDSADQQLWVAECQGSVSRDSDKKLQSASFRFYNYYWYKNQSKKYYLGGANNAPTVSETDKEDWTVSMNSTKPVGLSMDDITLYTFQMDQIFEPTLLNPGSDSKTWTVTPDLPDFMTLDTSTGIISQVTGVTPTVTASATYTLTASNTLGDASTTFTFEVLSYT